MRKSNREVNGEKVFRYSIRKYHFGAASVAVAALMFFANGAVKADTLPVSPATANTEKVSAGVTDLTEGVPLEKSLETEGNKEVVAPDSVEKTSNKEDGAGSNAQGEKEIKVSDKAVLTTNQTEEINKAETNGKEKEVVTNKDKLESLLKEIDQLNLKDYTEDTVKVLQEKVAKAKEVLVNATTQKEIDLAYNALVGYKNAGLKRVPKPKRELTPKPDTINGKTTVGLKAENTEPNATNIAGHNHSLNGTTRAEGSGFRDASTETLNIEWGYGSDYSTDGSYHRDKEFAYLGDQSRFSKNIVIKSKTGDITSVTAISSSGDTVKINNVKNSGKQYVARAIIDKLTGKTDIVLTLTVNVKGESPKTVQLGANRLLEQPVIKAPAGSTMEDYLKDKVGKKPTIDVEIPKIPKLPSYAKLKVYLVSESDRDKQSYLGDEYSPNEHPRFSNVTAKKEVSTGRLDPSTNKTIVTITESDYEKALGKGELYALTIIEVGDAINHNPGTRASKFSEGVQVGPKVNLADIKQAAKGELAKAAAEETKAINADKSLTTAKRNEKLQEVATKKTEGEQAIDATTVDDADKVEAAKNDALGKINNVHTTGDLNSVKQAAKGELAKAAAEETKAINADKSLTTAKRNEKLQEVATKKTEGEQAIDATTVDDADKVEAAKNDALGKINNVHTTGDLNSVKQAAKGELAKAAAEETKAINADKSLTTAKRNEKLQEVATKKTEGEQAIDATTVDDADKVEAAKNDALGKINNVHTTGDLNSVKQAAKGELAKAAAEETKAINADKSLTTAKRNEKLQEVATKKTEGEQAIDATTVDDADKVEAAKNDALGKINNVHTTGDLNSVKQAAKGELAKAAAEETKAINADKSLTTAKRNEKLQEVATKKTEGEQAIDATTVDDADKVEAAKNDALGKINNVHTTGDLNSVKQAAKGELAKAAAEETKAINADKSLTTAKRNEKLQEVATKKTEGEQAIDATTVDDADKVEAAKNDALGKINNVHTTGDLNSVKQAAKGELAKAAAEETKAINADKSLTTAKRNEKLQEVATKKTEGEQAIDATTVDDADKVEAAKNDALGKINNVHTTGDLNSVKQAAKGELAKAAAEETKAINADKSLTTAKRNEKLQEVATKKTEGEQAIDATTVDDADKVEAAKNDALGKINNVHTTGDLNSVKQAAKGELAKAAAEETKAINADKSLTTAKRNEKLQEVATKKTEGEQAIDATTVDDADKVEAAKNDALGKINNVHTTGDLNSVKQAAKGELAKAAAEETKAINADKSLTTAKRNEKLQEVATKKTEGEQAIDATTVDDADKVATAKTAGVAAIKAVHTAGDLNAVKNAAKAELATAAAEEKAEIAGDKSLTAAQRAEKEKAVDDTKAAEEAKITAADDADKVEAAKTAGVTAIKAVHTVGSLDDVKAVAKALPNTGTVKSTLAIPVAITSALLSLGLVGGRRRKEDEEV